MTASLRSEVESWLSDGYQVGRYGFACVGIGGNVTALGDGWVEIEGIRLPRSLDRGAVRYVSMEIPPEPCECDDLCDLHSKDDGPDWPLEILKAHNAGHDEPWLLCPEALCRMAVRAS